MMYDSELFRMCMRTRKLYYKHDNIPLRDNQITGYHINGKDFQILSQNHGRELDSWYEGKFTGDWYAVFVKSDYNNVRQQITPWYMAYGNAERRLRKFIEVEKEKEVLG